jgi:cell fate (sporulation/competence/biofilm development) regulator YlbF (YheA/YmcA/DUF963 family)
MKSPLEIIPSLEEVIKQLRNVDAKLDAGRIIRAYRENSKLLSYFENLKLEIITEAKKQSAVLPDVDLLGQIQDLEETIRQLHKINSLIYVGQIVAASGCNNKLIAMLKRKAYNLSLET